ncbi:hypothetical protein ACIBLA_34095 [Streptomyces sp. NPDC050433]|uniref:hypothetical protein n=1 Tax=Streptomyces sp. NPDC050433 TaxID=3365615 RepID=UPI00379E2D31
MRVIVAGHTAVTADEFVELALGTPLDLWLGVEGESEMERAAREDAARDILADDPSLVDRTSTVATETVEALAPDLFNVVTLPRHTARRVRAGKRAAA